MKICIKNIGLISESELDINGITVIGGYNNTGKSTLLKAIYGLLSSNHHMKNKIRQERKRSIRQSFYEHDVSFLIMNENVDTFLDRFLEETTSNQEKDQKFFYAFFKNAIEEEREKDEIEETISPKYEKTFDEHYKKSIEELYQDCNKILKTPEKEYQRFILSRTIRNIFFNDINSRNCTESASIEIETDEDMIFSRFVQNQLSSFHLCSEFKKNIWYLNTSHLMDIKDKINYIDQELKKALRKDIDMDISYEDYNDIEENSEKLQSILEDILHGRLEKNEMGTMLYRDDLTDARFRMDNVASGMKNLLMIQRMLENGTLGKNSILLMDEPETNLHPDWQIKYAKILVLLNKEMNIKLLVNSHSPYFIRAIEVALADYGRKNMGKFYLTESDGNGRYQTKDVTANTEEIYKLLYQPLDYL